MRKVATANTATKRRSRAASIHLSFWPRNLLLVIFPVAAAAAATAHTLVVVSAISALALAAAESSAEGGGDSNGGGTPHDSVQTLTGTTFDTALNDPANGLWFLKFYAPW